MTTVSRAGFRLMLEEEYRVALDTDAAGGLFQMRNALLSGVDAILSSFAIGLGALLHYGLPACFWLGVFYWPSRWIWRRTRALRAKVAA